MGLPRYGQSNPSKTMENADINRHPNIHECTIWSGVICGLVSHSGGNSSRRWKAQKQNLRLCCGQIV